MSSDAPRPRQDVSTGERTGVGEAEIGDSRRPARRGPRELLKVLGELALALALLAVSTLGPLKLAVLVSPWLGMATAVVGLGAWWRFGPRPFPALLPGLLCLSGYAAILASLVGCGVLAARGS